MIRPGFYYLLLKRAAEENETLLDKAIGPIWNIGLALTVPGALAPSLKPSEAEKLLSTIKPNLTAAAKTKILEESKGGVFYRKMWFGKGEQALRPTKMMEHTFETPRGRMWPILGLIVGEIAGPQTPVGQAALVGGGLATSYFAAKRLPQSFRATKEAFKAVSKLWKAKDISRGLKIKGTLGVVGPAVSLLWAAGELPWGLSGVYRGIKGFLSGKKRKKEEVTVNDLGLTQGNR